MRTLQRALMYLPLLLVSCSDDGEDDIDRRPFAEDVEVRESVGQEGAELESKGVRLVVPQGALEDPVEIELRTLRRGDERPLPERTELESRAYVLTPHGQSFRRSVELEFPHRRPEGGRTLRVARLDDEDDDRWQEVRGARFEDDTVSLRLEHFSIYAVVSCEGDANEDCGLDVEAGGTGDAGAMNDAGTQPEAGAQPEAGVMQEAGTTQEAGMPEASIPPVAQLSVQPTSANFGDVPVATGQSLPVTLTFQNSGTGDATGCSVVASDVAFVPFNDGCASTLPAGGSCTVDVRGEVGAESTIGGSVELQCDAGVSAETTLSIRGTVPALAMTPTTHSFGPIPAPSSGTQTFTFRNDGLAPATGCSAPLLAGADPTVFVIQADACGTANLAAGATCDVAVSFTGNVADVDERRATLQRSCAVGGAVGTTANGIVVNRPHYLFIREAEGLTGNLGGLAGADSICQAAANAGTLTAGMGLTWRALLSTTTVDARDRIDWQGPVFDVRGHYAVGDPNKWPWDMDGVDPGSPNLLGSTENEGTPGSYVWTGTAVDGTAAGAALTCGDWTIGDSSADAQAGETGVFPAANWLEAFPNGCSDSFFSLICVSDYP